MDESRAGRRRERTQRARCQLRLYAPLRRIAFRLVVRVKMVTICAGAAFTQRWQRGYLRVALGAFHSFSAARTRAR